MKYLKVFETEALQNEFRSSHDYIEPHVSCLINGENVKYNKSLEQLKVPFTIEATQDGTEIYFRQSSYAVDDGLDALKVEVSTDNGETWTEVTAAAAEDDVPGATLASLNAGDKVLVRGNNEAYGYLSPEESADDIISNCNFYAEHPCYVYGNIMSLVGGDNFAEIRNVKEYAFAYFFGDYDGELDYSWVMLKEGEELLLPATTLAAYCYYEMFVGCASLTTAPALSAMALAGGCYSGMFEACTSLISAPALPATTLAEGCYSYMFSNCTSLTRPPELPATTLADWCYERMFNMCISLTTAPELPATTLAPCCYRSMFQECASLTAAPMLPATTLIVQCYEGMFSYCTSLTSAPELPATSFNDSGCYNYMFSGCRNLAYIKAMFTTTPSSTHTQDWVSGVSASGTFVKNSAATWNVTGNNGIPSGWTVETDSA